MNIVLIFMLVLTFNDSLQLKDIFNYPAKEITVNENYLVGIIAQNKYRFYYDTCFVNYEKIYVTLNNEDFFAGLRLAGLSNEKIAEILNISLDVVKLNS